MMEPLDLWIERLPEPFRSRTHVLRPENGGFLEGSSGRIVLDGVETPKMAANPMVRRRSQRRVTANPGLMKVTENPSPDVFLEGFNVEGIDVGVFMPTIAMGMVRYDDLDPEPRPRPLPGLQRLHRRVLQRPPGSLQVLGVGAAA